MSDAETPTSTTGVPDSTTEPVPEPENNSELKAREGHSGHHHSSSKRKSRIQKMSIDEFNNHTIEEKKEIVEIKRQCTNILSIPVIQLEANEEEDEDDVALGIAVETSVQDVAQHKVPRDPKSMIVSVQTLNKYFSNPSLFTVEDVKTAFGHILHHLRPFYLYGSLILEVRSLLFLITEYPNKPLVNQYIKLRLSYISAELIHIKPIKTKHWVAAINNLTSSVSYDPEADLSPYVFRYQYAFETSIYNADEHLQSFVSQFFGTIDPTIRWSQLQAFSKEIAKYFHEQFGVYSMPQLVQYASRALNFQYTSQFGALLPYVVTPPEYVSQISKMRKLTAAKLLCREKFMAPGKSDIPIGTCPDLFPHSVSAANTMAYAIVPEDLFEAVIQLHDCIFDEILKNMHERSKSKEPFAKYKVNAPAIGQEDIMPIMILVLVLAELPNLGQICDFFNEYSIQIQNNSKTGLYMANITLAYGAIQSWSDFD